MNRAFEEASIQIAIVHFAACRNIITVEIRAVVDIDEANMDPDIGSGGIIHPILFVGCESCMIQGEEEDIVIIAFATCFDDIIQRNGFGTENVLRRNGSIPSAPVSLNRHRRRCNRDTVSSVACFGITIFDGLDELRIDIRAFHQCKIFAWEFLAKLGVNVILDAVFNDECFGTIDDDGDACAAAWANRSLATIDDMMCASINIRGMIIPVLFEFTLCDFDV